MKNMWVIILGVLNILACGSLVVLHTVIDWNAPSAFTWGLPLLIAAAVALICGIFTLKRRRWRWVVTGLVVAGVAWVYYLLLAWWINYWSMA